MQNLTITLIIMHVGAYRKPPVIVKLTPERSCYPLTINVPLFKKLRDNLRGQKSLGPLKMSLEMAHKVIVPPKKN